jgi:RNA polymerase sigma factor (sigma-70 family)
MSGELVEMQDALAKCLENLPPADREVVQRVYSSELTVRGVAEQLGRPLDTIKSVLKRSRRALYNCIRRALSTEARS